MHARAMNPSPSQRVVRSLVVVGAVLLSIIGTWSSAQAAPGVTVTSPSEGATIEGSDVTVTFNVSDFSLVPSNVPLNEAGMRPEANREGEGHLHFVLDLGPVVVWEQNQPYTFTNVPTGEHVLMVELVNNDHSPLSPPVMQEIHFRTVSGTVLANTGRGDAIGASSAMAVVAVGALALVVGGWLIRRRGISSPPA